MTVSQAYTAAIQHHRAGRLGDAEALYRQILAGQPNHAEALHHLGVIALQSGQPETALEWIRQALTIAPANPAAHSNFAEACRTMGRLDEAIAAYRQVLVLSPQSPEVENNLGNALKDIGQSEEAVTAYRRALALKPDLPETYNNLAILLAGQGLFDEAITTYERALQLKPDFAAAHNNLGTALAAQGRHGDAIAAFQHALESQPTYPEAHHNVGLSLQEQGRVRDAIAAFRRALQLRPYYPDAWNNLGNALRRESQLDEAETAYRHALQLRPENPPAWNNLGNALKDQGRVDEAIAAYRRACDLMTDYREAHSNLVYTLQFHPDYDDKRIAQEHQRWNRQFALPSKPLPAHVNDRDPERRLRLGYVSPDFRFQAEAHFVVPLLEAHDHQKFEIHCYASVASPDHVTDRLRRSADVWHDVHRLSDLDLAQQIRDNGIDILIDLTMHMARNRLLVFARRPAPVQVTWLAYPGSTGLDTMDYRLTDNYLDPPTAGTPCYSEQSVRLPDSWCCYHPLSDGPTVGSLPAADAAGITFGCLNNFCKINDQTVDLFAGALRAADGSRLLLMAPEGRTRARLLHQFSQHDVPPSRIEFVGRISRLDYLKLYHRIDIALDPLPYNGITTTCDALWMGVPVISLAGKTAAGRAGVSILSTLGLPELATRSPGEYAQAAKQLAHDRPALAALRAALRPRMETSPLMEAPRFARNLEAACRTMWQRWCADNSSR